MKTSDEYVADLEAVFGASIEGAAPKLSLHWDTIAEVRQMQKELRFIKKGVFQTMKELRAAFEQRSASAELGRQQVEKLAPYEAITHSIDNALLQLEVQTWLEENK